MGEVGPERNIEVLNECRVAGIQEYLRNLLRDVARAATARHKEVDNVSLAPHRRVTQYEIH